jgi:hypothetical protein
MNGQEAKDAYLAIMVFYGIVIGLPAVIALVFLIKNYYKPGKALLYVVATFSIYTTLLFAVMGSGINSNNFGSAIIDIATVFLIPISIVLLISFVVFLISAYRKNKKPDGMEEPEYLL